jgi:hypothetical protein
MCRLAAFDFESLGAVDPPRGHPAPGRLAFRVTREFCHPLTFRRMFEKFVPGIHRPVLLGLGLGLFDRLDGAAKLSGTLGKP